MTRISPSDLPYPDFPLPPDEDDLPYDDGEPMETSRHVLQWMLLMLPLKYFWRHRTDVYVAGNMFVYFSPNQVLTEDFKGPDLFIALDVSNRERKSWLVWKEEKAPDVVVELLSHSTMRKDKVENKRIYQDKLRVPEYFWYDPWTAERAGFALREGVYEPIEPDEHDRLPSRVLGLTLVKWTGRYQEAEATWLRWAGEDGVLLPTEEEAADEQFRRADEQFRRADEQFRRAEQAERRIAELEARLARYEGGNGTTG
ncbi:MAG: Uma2 family endonuclease [Chloroflexi bacterium]|nr:Uma2 family endonuclease [Chloroflexota bacterium]